jgi:membrane dipeptidase
LVADKFKISGAVLLFAALLVGPPAAQAQNQPQDFQQRVDHVLARTPLIDGHNDLPWEIHERFNGDMSVFDFAADTSRLPLKEGQSALMTDIPRLRAGHVGAQFWSVWIPANTPGYEAVQITLEQIDLVKRMTAQYPKDLEMAYGAADIRRIHKNGKVASLIGIEGGHQINNSLAVLRQMYDAGARYMTLTHSNNTAWADSATDNPVHHGLTAFGVEVVREMNRMGMLVDLSHVSDEVLVALAANGGVVMVNFAPPYVSSARNRWEADLAAERARSNTPPFGGLYIGQPDKAKAALEAWQAQHPRPDTTLAQVADHVEHIRRVAGIDHVGLGSDFDGIPDAPVGLEGVNRYPALLQELMRRGWSDEDIAKLAGENLLRVLAKAETVSAKLRQERSASIATLALDK